MTASEYFSAYAPPTLQARRRVVVQRLSHPQQPRAQLRTSRRASEQLQRPRRAMLLLRLAQHLAKEPALVDRRPAGPRTDAGRAEERVQLVLEKGGARVGEGRRDPGDSSGSSNTRRPREAQGMDGPRRRSLARRLEA